MTVQRRQDGLLSKFHMSTLAANCLQASWQIELRFTSVSKGILSELALNHNQLNVVMLQSSSLNTNSKLYYLPLPKNLRFHSHGGSQSTDLSK